MISDTSSSEKPEFCWPSRRGSTTVCVAADTHGQECGHDRTDRRGTGVNRTLGRLGVAIVVHWDVSDPSPAGSGVLVDTVSILSRQRSGLRVWHESEWCSTRNGSRSTKWECDRRQIRNRARVVVPTDARLDSGRRAIVVRCETRSRWLARQPGENGSRHDGFRISRPLSGFGLSLAVKRSARSTIEDLAGATVLAQMEQLSHLQRRQGKQKREDANDRWEGPSRRPVWRQRCSLIEFEPVRCTVRPHVAERGSITRTRATPPRKCQLESSAHWAPTARTPPANALQRVWRALKRDWSRAFGAAVDPSRLTGRRPLDWTAPVGSSSGKQNFPGKSKRRRRVQARSQPPGLPIGALGGGER